MEARSFISGFCSNPIINNPIQNPSKASFPTVPSYSNQVSFKTIYSLSWKLDSLEYKLQCRSSLQKVEAVSGDTESQKSGDRKKNLAVFVSGGGSNFRSIHKAIVEGSVEGEIVVLVTNKPGDIRLLKHSIVYEGVNAPKYEMDTDFVSDIRAKAIISIEVVGLVQNDGSSSTKVKPSAYKPANVNESKVLNEVVCNYLVQARFSMGSGCGGAEYARDNNIPVILFPGMKEQPDGLSANDLVTTLRRYKIDFILLAGYLKLIPVELVRAYPRLILNIHPSLLPAFGGKGYYGMKVHQAVIASGARYSGPTIHFVDEHYDTGRILAQRVVPVLTNDTADELAARVLQQVFELIPPHFAALAFLYTAIIWNGSEVVSISEHQLYVEVAEALCEERIVWREDGVPLIRNKENPSYYK
ncbi:hypothetical protein RHSIM_Rhsim04G0089100 [Rhododendron simsii]|uniref:phosphoribosylglycinamide formyltransferase 1 n=1 Tax=Rhododendron simsii TaxID=118357 RepID=A0A834LQN5_RHOSS|nr:hypothetical protein RHSIM_Rhsim04G0089100 [Rhododendron simsii]